MIPVTAFAGKKVAIFGLGGSGLASASALLAGGADVIGWDDSADAVAKAATRGHSQRRSAASRLVENFRAGARARRAAHASHAALDGGARARRRRRGDRRHRAVLPRAARARAEAPFVAITGTNGKSTTTALVAHLLRAAGREAEIGGNIGTAILSLAPPDARRAHVIECSSYQIDLAPTLDPSVGVLLNVTADHLDRHGTMEHYAAVKERLVAGVQKDGMAIVGVDDPWCAAAADRIAQAGRELARVSVAPAAARWHLCRGRKHHAGDRRRSSQHRPHRGIGSLRGVHNAQNAACAAGAALALGLSAEEIQQGLVSFPGLAHRMEEVGRKGRVLFVNDSKATNADSAAQALACFSDIFWIAGGKAKKAASLRLRAFFRASARPI